MKAIGPRIRRLEERLAPKQCAHHWHIARIVFDRRRSRVIAAGERFDELPPAPPPPGFQLLSIAETLRRRRQVVYERTSRYATRGRNRRNNYRYHVLTL
jgi:hypothetical protein